MIDLIVLYGETKRFNIFCQLVAVINATIDLNPLGARIIDEHNYNQLSRLLLRGLRPSYNSSAEMELQIC